MSEIFYAGFIPFYLTTPDPFTWLIYRIDDEPGDGDTVPNLGYYPYGSADMTITDIGGGPGGVEQLIATSPVSPTSLHGHSIDWYTVLIRIGDLATPIAAGAGGGVSSIVQAQADGYLWGMYSASGDGGGGFIEHQNLFLVDGFTTGVVDSDVTIMVTVNPSTGEYRQVFCDGVSVVDYTTMATVFNAGNFGFVVRLIKTYGAVTNVDVLAPWAQSYNGLAVWREECVTDDDFLYYYNQFANA